MTDWGLCLEWNRKLMRKMDKSAEYIVVYFAVWWYFCIFVAKYNVL